jgi:2'-5' RNA ligase
MRLFIAFDIDAATRAQLTSVREAIERVISAAASPPRVTWVKSEAAHVTLRFIGETPPQTLEAVQQALGGMAVEPFEVRWDAVGTFGGTRHPRVIWISPGSGIEQCRELVGRLDVALEALVGPGESRPFVPHLTLGRVRAPGRRVDWARALAAVRWEPTVTLVDQIVLYQSQLSPKGPTYTALSTRG